MNKISIFITTVSMWAVCGHLILALRQMTFCSFQEKKTKTKND